VRNYIHICWLFGAVVGSP